MKLSFNEAKLTGLFARNCATIQQVLILKFVFGPEKFPGLLRDEPLNVKPLTKFCKARDYKGKFTVFFLLLPKM